MMEFAETEAAFDLQRTHPKKRAVNLIPLIDVAMFLLIFFMVAGTVQRFEVLPVDPPISTSGKSMDEGRITIVLGAREEMVVDDELVELPRLEQYVKGKIASNPNKLITVKADATIPAVRLVQVMNRIKAAGGKNLSIITQPPSHASR